jgi:hypothetical protein
MDNEEDREKDVIRDRDLERGKEGKNRGRKKLKRRGTLHSDEG